MTLNRKGRLIESVRQIRKPTTGPRRRLTVVFVLAAAVSMMAGTLVNKPAQPALASEPDWNPAASSGPTEARAVSPTRAEEGDRSPAVSQEGIQIELVTIRTRGFEPSQITRSKGRFILAVYNRSGLEEVNLHLDHEAGLKLRQERVPRTKLDWYAGLDLPPGKYFLTEANHSDWRCAIVVTPN